MTSTGMAYRIMAASRRLITEDTDIMEIIMEATTATIIIITAMAAADLAAVVILAPEE